MVASRKKRRPAFLIRICERETEDELGDLFLGAEVLDIALDGSTLDVAFRLILREALGRKVAMVNSTEAHYCRSANQTFGDNL